ncbi:phiSA1p31-related protein [Streptomyces sp. NPDC002125]
MTILFTIPEDSGIGTGVTIDLDRAQADVFGWHWKWTGAVDGTGMPLMHTEHDAADLRLCFLYELFGPLVPAPGPVTAEERHAVLAAPVCTGPVSQSVKTVPTPRTFAGLLGRLRGRSA